MAAELVCFEGCIFKKLSFEKCEREKYIYSWEMGDEPLLIRLYNMLFYTIESLDQNTSGVSTSLKIQCWAYNMYFKYLLG